MVFHGFCWFLRSLGSLGGPGSLEVPVPRVPVPGVPRGIIKCVDGKYNKISIENQQNPREINEFGPLKGPGRRFAPTGALGGEEFLDFPWVLLIFD